MGIILSVSVEMTGDQENKDSPCEKEYKKVIRAWILWLTGLHSLISCFLIDCTTLGKFLNFCSLSFLICKMGTLPTT